MDLRPKSCTESQKGVGQDKGPQGMRTMMTMSQIRRETFLRLSDHYENPFISREVAPQVLNSKSKLPSEVQGQKCYPSLLFP